MRVPIYLLMTLLLVACTRKSSKKMFALEKDDFNYHGKAVNPLQKEIRKYPATVYSFGTCNKNILYKGVSVDEYTTDCNDPDKFVEETFLIFLDSNRVYYYSKGRKSNILNLINIEQELNAIGRNRLAAVGEITYEEPIVDADNKEYIEYFRLKETISTNFKIDVRLNDPMADYQRRGYYSIIEDCSVLEAIDTSRYLDTEYCLEIELERPTKKSKINGIKEKLAEAKIEAKAEAEAIIRAEAIKLDEKAKVVIAKTTGESEIKKITEAKARVFTEVKKKIYAETEAKAKNKVINKKLDRVYMRFRVLREKKRNKIVLKLISLKKSQNRSRILGEGESRTVFANQTFREQVVFYPRVKDSLAVFIEDELFFGTAQQLSKINW